MRILEEKPVKKITVLFVVLGLIALTAGAVPAEMYVEGYIGNNFTITSPNPLGFDVNQNYKAVQAYPEYPRTLSSNVIGGGKLGIWCSKQGYPHVDFPDWMKYFGFYLDFNFHGLDYKPGVGTRRINISPSTPPYFDQYKFLGNGSIATFGFMFAARYGFFPTEKVPFGKLQPYLALGPAIMLTNLGTTYMSQPSHHNLFPYFGVVYAKAAPTTTVSPGLQVELGLRYMITRFLSVETSAKYRYTSFATSYDVNIDGYTHQLRYAPQLNLFSIYSGLAYHF
jgi:hypothetical protein